MAKKKMTAAEKAAWVKKMAAARKGSAKKPARKTATKKATKKATTRRKNPVLMDAYSAGRARSMAKNLGRKPSYSTFEAWYKAAGKKAKGSEFFDKNEARDMWTEGVNSVRTNPAKKKPAKKTAVKKKNSPKKATKRARKASSAATKRKASTKRNKGTVKAKNKRKTSKRSNAAKSITSLAMVKAIAAARVAKRKMAAKRKNKGKRKPVKRNGAGKDFEAAMERHEYFHGPNAEGSNKVIDVSMRRETVDTVSGIGKLIELSVLTESGFQLDLTSFGGAILTQDVGGGQLYITGGKQGVRLADFDLENNGRQWEVLGAVPRIVYGTDKTHLHPKDGGKAHYEHFFGENGGRLPVLIYDALNEELILAGGGYKLPSAGIDD